MFRIREVLTFAALVVLTAISVASAVHVVRSGLHEPRLAADSDLFTLISTTDLTEEPVDMRLRVVRRLEPEFLRGVAWSNRIEALDDEQWQRMQKNFIELTRLWLVERAESYHALPEGEAREHYFESEAKNLIAWGATSLNRRDRSVQNRERGQGRRRRLTRVMELVISGGANQWEWQSSDEEESVVAFLADAQEMFAKMMQRQGGLGGGVRSPLGTPSGF